MAWASLASWYSGDEDTDFNFDKKLKERYKKVTEIYAKTQNVQVSRGFLFGAFTVVLLGQVGMKAHSRKQQLIKISAFRRDAARRVVDQAAKRDTRQISMFPDEEVEIKQERITDIPDRDRKNFAVDERGYYTHAPEGGYLKKTERTRKPSAQMWAFIQEFKKQHNRQPNNKEVKTFLQSV